LAGLPLLQLQGLHGELYEPGSSDQGWVQKRVRFVTRETGGNALLKQRLKEIGADQLGLKRFIGPRQERVIVSELLDALQADYRLRDVRGLSKSIAHLRPVREFFGDYRAIDVTEEKSDRYIEQRLAEGKAPGTVNRETQHLGQAFRLGIERKLISFRPILRRLPERNVRRGFFERAEFEALLLHLPEGLKDFVHFGFLSGWRRGEIATFGMARRGSRWQTHPLAGRARQEWPRACTGPRRRIMGHSGA